MSSRTHAEPLRLRVVGRDLRRADGPADLRTGRRSRITTSCPAATATRPSAATTPIGPRLRLRATPRARARAPDPVSTGSAAGSAASSVSTRLSRPRNSKRRKISLSVERSGGDATSAATSTSSGRSRRIVARTSTHTLVGVLHDGLRAGGRELAGVRDDVLERAVLRDQLAGGLVPDPGNAGDVVRRVALQADEVRHLVGADAVPELDPLGRVDVDVRDSSRRHHQRDVLAAELERVPVGGDDAGCGSRPRPRRVASVAITSSASHPSNSRFE